MVTEYIAVTKRNRHIQHNTLAIPRRYTLYCVLLLFFDLQLKGNVDAFPIPVWAAILISFFLVPLTGLFAGLTLGLLSLDRVGLKVRFVMLDLSS